MCRFIYQAPNCVCIVIGEFTYVLRVSSGSFLVNIPVSGSTVVNTHLHSKKKTPNKVNVITNSDNVITKHAASMGEPIRNEPSMKTKHFCRSVCVRVI